MKELELLDWAVKGVMLTIAGAYMAWLAGSDLRTARREPAPTALRVDDFPAAYRGQQWLQLTGWLAPE